MHIYNAMCDILPYIILIKHGYDSIYPNNKYQYKIYLEISGSK